MGGGVAMVMMMVTMVMTGSGKGRRREQHDCSEQKSLFHARNHNNAVQKMTSAAGYFWVTTAPQ